MVPIRQLKPYSLLVADQQILLRAGLAAICNSMPNYEVVHQCSDGGAALRIITSQPPDIAVLDLGLHGMPALQIVRRIREAGWPTRTVVLSAQNDRQTVIDALRCGVDAFVLKSASPDQLLHAFQSIQSGWVYLSPGLVLDEMLYSRLSSDNPTEALSSREYQVFSLLIEGVRYKEIAARLELSPKTVDTYRASLMRKLDIHDVAGLVKLAIRHGLTTITSQMAAG